MTIFENVKFNNDFLLCSHLVGPRWGFVTCKGLRGGTWLSSVSAVLWFGLKPNPLGHYNILV
jgi:hypothetical protein